MYIIYQTSKEVLICDEEHNLEILQSAVGGYIELVPDWDIPPEFDRNFTYYCNEEGRLKGLPYNPFFRGIVGNVVACREKDED
jgi:hypothetical protein